MNEAAASIFLYLIIAMPADTPDMVKKLPMPSLEECLANVKAWDERGLTQEMSDKGAIGVMAACKVLGKPT